MKILSTFPENSQEKLTTFYGKFYNFLKKICRFLQENVTGFTVKSDNFCRKIGWSLQEHLTI